MPGLMPRSIVTETLDIARHRRLPCLSVSTRRLAASIVLVVVGFALTNLLLRRRDPDFPAWDEPEDGIPQFTAETWPAETYYTVGTMQSRTH